MVKACSMPLSQFGLIIGWLFVFGALFYIIVMYMVFDRLNEVVTFLQQIEKFAHTDPKELEKFLFVALCILLSVFIVIGIVSSLLITGIFKRRHELIAPLLVVWGVIVFYCLYNFFDDIITGRTLNFFAVIGIILQCAIYYPIFLLFMQIRSENNPRNRPTNQTSSNPLQVNPPLSNQPPTSPPPTKPPQIQPPPTNNPPPNNPPANQPPKRA